MGSGGKWKTHLIGVAGLYLSAIQKPVYGLGRVIAGHVTRQQNLWTLLHELGTWDHDRCNRTAKYGHGW